MIRLLRLRDQYQQVYSRSNSRCKRDMHNGSYETVNFSHSGRRDVSLASCPQPYDEIVQEVGLVISAP